jgi:hypothetical protein
VLIIIHVVILCILEDLMDTDTTTPWDCLDTFGKRFYRNESGQAHLCQWPLKIKLISPVAPYFHNAHLLLAADCAAFSHSNFHDAILRNRILIIGCPELDGDEFAERLLEIVRCNDIQSVAVARMDAPCCKKLTNAAISAIRLSRKDIPIQFITVFAEGEIID